MLSNKNPAVLQSVRIAVVIPCYKVTRHIEDVINAIPSQITGIFCIDDACPEKSGLYIQEKIQDSRIRVITHSVNQGVGGAVLTGFAAAAESNFDIFVKLDGDGQMDPQDIPRIISPLIEGTADYSKGNRFYFPRDLKKMPFTRLVGNSALSFINKIVTGYWSVMDPTNGFVAITRPAFELLPADRIAKRYFFESDMLYRLSIIRAAVQDIPIPVKYADEISHLRISQVLFDFPPRFGIRLAKRILYLYFIRDFSAGSISLLGGISLFSFGLLFGIYHWVYNAIRDLSTPVGTVMIAALSVILGFQLLLNFLNYDIQNEPRRPIAHLGQS